MFAHALGFLVVEQTDEFVEGMRSGLLGAQEPVDDVAEALALVDRLPPAADETFARAGRALTFSKCRRYGRHGGDGRVAWATWFSVTNC
jgi:hypothetical protein